MIEAVVFDMDGVLAVSEPGRYKVLTKIFKEKKLKLPRESYSVFPGKTTKEFLVNDLHLRDKGLINGILEEYNHEYKGNILNYTDPIPLTIDFLKKYKGTKKIGVASNSTRKVVDDVLTGFGILKKFSAIISREDVSRHKPNPEIYLKAAEELRVDPGECAAVEDTAIGATAALAGGLKCFAYLNNNNSKDSFRGLKITGFIMTRKDLENLFI